MSTQAVHKTDDRRQLFRHAVATLAYRGGKAVADAPAGFNEFRLNDSTRTPGEILSHIGDLLDWALSMAEGKQAWRDSKVLSWDDQVARFFSALEALDTYMASDAPLAVPVEKLFQGPIADALTHVGQICILRRMAGGPVIGENYFKAEIEVGRVGADQSNKRFEFD